VAKYSLEIKSSAQRELDALDDTLFARIDRKIMSLADNPVPQDARNSRGIVTIGESG
jgi:mRNA-degrading endonuclease RelE of RelBE toxin-antitoxin system